MSLPVARMGGVLGLGGRAAWLIALAAIAGIALVAAAAARLDVLPLLLGVVILGIVAIAGFRWPLLPLFIFVAMIPIEEMVVIDGLGTVSRLAGILFAVVYGLPRLGRLRLGAMPVGAWAYLAWAAVSLGWAVDPGVAWASLATLLQLFLIAVLVADLVSSRPEVVRSLFWVYSISAAATAVIGIQSYVSLGIAESRAAAIQGQDPAQFAALMLPALVFGLHEMVDGRRKVPGGAIALLTTVGVVVSGTRGAWVAIGVVLVLMFARLEPRRRFTAIGAVVALVAVLYLVPGVPNLVAERAGTALSTGGEGRTDIWSVAGLIYGRSPVVGVGYANFPVVYTLATVRASGVLSVSAYVEGRGPHNVLVGTLIELGPLGVLLLFLFLGPLVVQRGWGPDGATVQAALASLLTMALFLDILANRKQVWLLVGLAAGLIWLAHQRRGAAADGGSAEGEPVPVIAGPGPATDVGPAPGGSAPPLPPVGAGSVVARSW
jgi:O-antigen ligase